MPIIYAVVAKGSTILAHYTHTSGNFMTVTSILLQRISPNVDNQMSYTYDKYQIVRVYFHNGITYLCLVDSDFDRKLAFAFLFEMKSQFISKFHDESVDLVASAYSLNSQFSTELASLLNYFSRNPANERLSTVRNQMGNAKRQMVENIDKLLSRQEKVELLVGSSETLVDQSLRFRENSRQYQWESMKRNAVQFSFLVVLALLILWLFVSLFCGLTFKRC